MIDSCYQKHSRTKFHEKVLPLELRCCQGQPVTFPTVLLFVMDVIGFSLYKRPEHNRRHDGVRGETRVRNTTERRSAAIFKCQTLQPHGMNIDFSFI